MKLFVSLFIILSRLLASHEAHTSHRSSPDLPCPRCIPLEAVEYCPALPSTPDSLVNSLHVQVYPMQNTTPARLALDLMWPSRSSYCPTQPPSAHFNVRFAHGMTHALRALACLVASSVPVSLEWKSALDARCRALSSIGAWSIVRNSTCMYNVSYLY
jgi:hypothetical protein